MRVQAADSVRRRIGASIFERVAGPEGPDRRRVIHQGEGDRWFAEDRPIRRVHGDSSMFVGGIRALLLQSLHPLAMAGVDAHSGYRGDPWGRLQRTSYFLAVTTFGRASDAKAATERVKAIHRRVTGTAPDGRPYAASDPHLLTWVHTAEADSFLRAHTRFGAEPLDQAGRDGYVADVARIAGGLGGPGPPRTLCPPPPLPMVAGGPYGVLAAAATSLLPGWARRPLYLPNLPLTERAVVRPAGHAVIRGIRWAITPPPSAQAASVQVPGVQVPGVQVPCVQVPGVQVPGVQVPGVQVPGVQAS